MCFNCQAFNNFLIHEEVRFNIGQRVQQYEKQANEGYQKLVFNLGGWIRFHMRKNRFLMQRCSKLHARVDGLSKIINKIEENDCRLKLLDDYDVSPIFNAKYLRPYHGEDLRTTHFSQLWGIDVGASTTNLENLILIMENLDLGICKTFETPNILLFQVF